MNAKVITAATRKGFEAKINEALKEIGDRYEDLKFADKSSDYAAVILYK